MFETLSVLPVAFWVVIAILIAGACWATTWVRMGTGIPTLAVLGTLATWYVGDALYNDYAGFHARLFDSETLRGAWWEVAWFLIVFLSLVLSMHRWINVRYLQQSGRAFLMFKHGVNQPLFQKELKQIFGASFKIWVVIAVLASIRLQGEAIYYFFPFLGHLAQPWGRQRVGGGISALLTLLFYVQELIAATFGVVAAATTSPRTRWQALALCFLSWPFFLLDRTRSNILVVIMPGILVWGLLVVRGGLLKKTAALGAFFILINAWMGFVIANRSDNSITGALAEKGFQVGSSEKTHHQGLNMYEELCWINSLLGRGAYRPNWGARYFAEAVNFVPRAIWPGKPEIGIDYAIARGQGLDSGQAGVGGTVSTGMIGQGVVNFGPIFGPAAAALLMSIWVAVLARFDLDSRKIGGVPLLGLGLILTFNMGRDISLIVLYPFVFSVLLIWVFERFRSKPAARIPHPSVPVNEPSGPGRAPGSRVHVRRSVFIPRGIRRLRFRTR